MIEPSQRWGTTNHKFAKVPVLKKNLYCRDHAAPKHIPSATGHTCCNIQDHEDDHICLCGVSWPKTPVTTDA